MVKSPIIGNLYLADLLGNMIKIQMNIIMHVFSRKQPDLNWENPNVRKELI